MNSKGFLQRLDSKKKLKDIINCDRLQEILKTKVWVINGFNKSSRRVLAKTTITISGEENRKLLV